MQHIGGSIQVELSQKERDLIVTSLSSLIKLERTVEELDDSEVDVLNALWRLLNDTM